MKLVDANVLLYAVNRDAERHDKARTWLEGCAVGRRHGRLFLDRTAGLHPSRHQGRVVPGVGVGWNLVTDAHLAALAIEHRCTIISYDGDFARFEGVRWATPTP